MSERILSGLLRTYTFALLLASLPLSVGGDVRTLRGSRGKERGRRALPGP
jgi:hypothetical protein